ncbi:MAG: Rrf2 family transcriptional regulator [Planctomycetota bacterium]|nr:Rrf2 family transcriptional regulator [Planctomycetota bacterium]
MTQLYSRGVEYALRCLRLMASNPATPRTILALCSEAQLPEHFTRKMLQPLVKAQLLKSHRGPGGGFVFTVPPAEITLRTVVEAIEGSPRARHCILGHSECSSDHPCALHDQWSKICDLSDQLLDQTSVLDLTSEWDGSSQAPILGEDRLTAATSAGSAPAAPAEKPVASPIRRYMPRQ